MEFELRDFFFNSGRSHSITVKKECVCVCVCVCVCIFYLLDLICYINSANYC
jgi:hypothetical protein